MNRKKCWRLTVRDEFCSAHALRHYEGKCEHLHGHNFGVELTVQGEELLPDTELLLDFKVLRQVLKETLDTLGYTADEVLADPRLKRGIEKAVTEICKRG